MILSFFSFQLFTNYYISVIDLVAKSRVGEGGEVAKQKKKI